MNALWKLLKADFLKMEHTFFYWIHFIMPTVGIVLFLSYYSFAKWEAISKIEGYIQGVFAGYIQQGLTVAFPLLISVICSFTVEQEALAGNFKELLSTEYGKCKIVLSKIGMLLICGFCSTLFAVVGFAAGFHMLLGHKIVPFFFCFEISLISFSCQIFCYLLHLWLSFRFGKGASVGVGFMESLVAALMLTGMGDQIWKWIPCAWSGRLSGHFFVYRLKFDNFSMVQADARMGTIICICMTGVMFIAFMIWFSFYEGRKEI